MHKPRVSRKIRDQANNIVASHAARLQIQTWIEENGLEMDEFDPWNDREGTIRHIPSNLTLNQRMTRKEVDEFLKLNRKVLDNSR